MTTSRLALMTVGTVVRKLEKKPSWSIIIWGRLEAIDAAMKDLASEWWACARVISSWESSILQISCLEWSDISTSCSLSSLKNSFALVAGLLRSLMRSCLSLRSMEIQKSSCWDSMASLMAVFTWLRVAGPSSGGSCSPSSWVMCLKSDLLVTHSILFRSLASGRSGFGRSDILELF